jgi:hypothetical protein
MEVIAGLLFQLGDENRPARTCFPCQSFSKHRSSVGPDQITDQVLPIPEPAIDRDPQLGGKLGNLRDSGK